MRSVNAPTLPPVKCLLVDDLDENLLALAALLRGDGVEILTAKSGTAALEILLAHDVALAFLDVQMPDMDGFELAELIRGSERTRHVPLIFVTAGARDQHRHFRGYELGAVDFLYKPVDPHILASKSGVFFQLYRQKQQIARELRARTEALEMNELFVAVLGHDLRSPLGAVLNSAALIEMTSTDPAVKAHAARIGSSGGRMNRLINDILDLARSRRAGGLPINAAPADLSVIVRRAADELMAANPARRIETSQEGSSAGAWDADRLAQVITNLLQNAIHHGAADSAVRVTLDGGARDSVTMCVINRGVIRPDLLPHIFDPFRGARSAAANQRGLGLGLYIVRQIMQAHGGRIKVESDEATGTCFRVTLPRSAEADRREEDRPGSRES